jgi:hypothetical protein
MNTRSVRLVLGDVETEVVAEALDLYLRTRPPQADGRFEYRYRAARAVLDNLRQDGESEPAAQGPAGDDESVVTTRLWDRRNSERLED